MDFSKAYDRNEFLNFLKRDFLPNDFQVKETSLDFESTYTRKVTKLGEVESLEAIVLEVQHSGKEDPRVGLSKEAFRILAGEWAQRALVIFVPQDNAANYRFSLIEVTLEGDKETAKVYRKYSNPRRYSYKLGVGIAYYTPNKYLNEKGRVANPDDLRNRFSVEVLTKEFYQELSDWYAWAVKIVRFPNKLNDPTDDDKFNAENTIRLITRLIFVWFLKQKNLIPNELFDEVYIRENLIANFSPEYNPSLFYNAGKSTFYKAILQNLFFAMLNSPITVNGNRSLSERHFCNKSEDDGNSKLMHYESLFSNPLHFIELANKQVPFLNGGLFDCLDDIENGNYTDGFSNKQEVQKALFVPDYLFFAKELIVDLSHWYDDKKKNKVKVRGLLHILKCYNFTIEENTPFDQEVSLDPELLGKVFENLLASYNPETQTTARKQTGSFYTPREIVQYMVDESLIAHLKRTVGKELEPQYRQLIQYSDDEVELTTEQRKKIIHSLYNCKILDPACGSGAFPVGMLQQMVHILNRIDPGNTMWKEMMRAVAIDKTSKANYTASDDECNEISNDIERNFNENINRPDYARKLYLIENCIYGVDIQPIAIQISKLRFFISLVVDQRTNTDPTDNFGIRPLPNLEAKFVAANTLIGLDKKDSTLFDTPEILAKKEELKVAKHKIFGAKTVKTKQKYKEAVNHIRQEIAELLRSMGAIGESEAAVLASWDMFDQNASSPFFDPEWMFGIKDGFDIVIGNPPYGAQLSKADKNIFRQIYPETRFKINTYSLFILKAMNLLGYECIASYILPNTLLDNLYEEEVRRKLLQKFVIVEVNDLNDKVFDGAVVHAMIISFVNRRYNDYNIQINSTENLYDVPQKIPASYFLQQPNAMISIRTFESHELIDKLNSKCIPLEDVLDIRQAIKTGNDKKYLTYRKEAENFKPILRGKDINRYSMQNPRIYVNYGKHLACPRNNWIFEQPKILIREAGKTITATFDDENFYIMSSLYNAILRNPDFNLKYILALINSKVYQFLMDKLTFEKTKGAFTKAKIFHYYKLPVKRPANQQEFANLVDLILSTKQRAPSTDTTLIENKLDLMIYHLYELTYDEVLIIDPQTPITREEYEKE